MEDVYQLMSIFRNAKKRLNEDEKDGDNSEGVKKEMSSYKENADSIPYKPEDQLYQDTINTLKAQVGASFGDSCLLFYPADNDVVVSGEIPSLNAAFQFRLNDPSGGCYLFCKTYINLNIDSLHTLNVLFGCFKNWQESIRTQSDYKPMGMNNNGAGTPSDMQAQNSPSVPGDL